MYNLLLYEVPLDLKIMNYHVEINIDRPLQEVITLFDSSENLKQWQPSLQSFKHLEGVPGQNGAKSLLTYIERGKKVELIETIVNFNLPEEFTAYYDAKGVHNKVTNRFKANGPNKTTWKSENTFQLSGLQKITGFLFKSLFVKQSTKDMNNFKKFAETSELLT